MEDDLILHCPQCGAALSVPIEIKSAEIYSSSTVVFHFKGQNVSHTCGVDLNK